MDRQSKWQFSSKDAYLLDQRHQTPINTQLSSQHWRVLWQSKIHERLKLLLWKVAWNAMPTNEILGQRFKIEFSYCFVCHRGTEPIEHILLHCPYSKIIWSYLHWQLQLETFANINAIKWVEIVLGSTILYAFQLIVDMDFSYKQLYSSTMSGISGTKTNRCCWSWILYREAQTIYQRVAAHLTAWRYAYDAGQTSKESHSQSSKAGPSSTEQRTTKLPAASSRSVQTGISSCQQQSLRRNFQ